MGPLIPKPAITLIALALTAGMLGNILGGIPGLLRATYMAGSHQPFGCSTNRCAVSQRRAQRRFQKRRAILIPCG